MATNNATKLSPETEFESTVEAPEIDIVDREPQLSVQTSQSELASFNMSDGERAVQLVLPALNDIRLSDVRRLHITSPSLVSAGLVYASNFAEDRSLFDAAFKTDGFDVASYDNLRERAMAYWHLCIVARQNPDVPLKPLLAEAKPLRAKLIRAATYLWGEDSTLGDIVAGIRNGQAYLNQADDLGALATLFADNWERAEGRCDVTKEDIVNARTLGEKFLEGVGRIKTEELTAQKELRLKSGEYLLRGIEGIRNAAVFIFGTDEQLLSRYPALSVMRRRKTAGSAEDTEDVNTEVVDTDGVDTDDVDTDDVDSDGIDTEQVMDLQPVLTPVQPTPTV